MKMWRKTTVDWFLGICLVVIPTASRTQASTQAYVRTVDTIETQLTYDELDSKIARWVDLLEGESQVCHVPLCDTFPSFYSLPLLRVGVFAKREQINSNQTRLILLYLWRMKTREQIPAAIGKATGALKQELGMELERARVLNKKSYASFSGLTLINSGLGKAYAGGGNAYSKPSAPLAILGGIIDAICTAGLVFGDATFRKFSLGGLLVLKGTNVFTLSLISGHNKLVDTGYKFRPSR